MLFWESRRRLQGLIRFHALAEEYFQNVQYAGWMAGRDIPPSENAKAQKARQEINRMLDDLALSFALLGIDPSLTWTPPPMMGGYVQHIDVIMNLFGLWRFEISPAIVFDNTERAIGAYERECRKLRRKLFNPVYWLGLLIVGVLRLPFKLLGAAGFNAARVENSLFGKLTKVCVGTVLFFAAVIPAVLEVADHWQSVKSFGGLCLTTLHRL
jgi:hypothetical protein